MPGCLKRNYISEDVLRAFFSHVLNPKNVLFNWLLVRSCDFIHERAVRHYNELMTIPRDGTYDAELDFMKSHPLHASMFPYLRVKETTPVESGKNHGLPFVVHEGKKLFFPKSWTLPLAESEYRGLVEEEGLLGTGHLQKSPHCYITDSFKVDNGDVLLDVGSAEGLFALDNIDVASKVYIFESLRCWRKPLNATFQPFGEKVTIVNKYVGRMVSRKTTTLSEVLGNGKEDVTYFIKMDIEGAEREVLCASEEFLCSHRVKVACAAYHRQDDANYLKSLLEKMGFAVQFSDGYMLPLINDFIYPYFRHGMIHARNY